MLSSGFRLAGLTGPSEQLPWFRFTESAGPCRHRSAHLSSILAVVICVCLSGSPLQAQEPTPAQNDPPTVPVDPVKTEDNNGAEKDAGKEKGAKEKERDERIDLMPEALPSDSWVFASGKKDAVVGETWELRVDPETSERILVCKGEPHGYLRTAEEFENFQMHVEWRFPTDPNGNSGVLVHASGEDRIWPTGQQIQFYQPELGAIFPIGAGKTDRELRDIPTVAKPVNHWNECLITCLGGKIELTINGQDVGQVTGCEPHSGSVAFQSEGSEIHFRHIWIRPLPSREQATEVSRKPNSEPQEATAPPEVRKSPESVFLRTKERRKQKTPLVTRTLKTQVARGEKRRLAEWVRLQTCSCVERP